MIAERIREMRTEMGITQKELAERIGSSGKNVWAYENGNATPPVDVMIRLADCFQCSVDYLVGRNDDFGNGTGEFSPFTAVRNREEQELIEHYRRSSEKVKKIARAVVRDLSET